MHSGRPIATEPKTLTQRKATSPEAYPAAPAPSTDDKAGRGVGAPAAVPMSLAVRCAKRAVHDAPHPAPAGLPRPRRPAPEVATGLFDVAQEAVLADWLLRARPICVIDVVTNTVV